MLVEKPLAYTSAEARALGREARRRGRILMVNHLYRFHAVTAALASSIRRAPERPELVRGTFLNPRSEYASGLDINLELLHWFDLIYFPLRRSAPSMALIHVERRRAAHDAGLRHPASMHARLRLQWEAHRRARTLTSTSTAHRQPRAHFIENAIASPAPGADREAFPPPGGR